MNAHATQTRWITTALVALMTVSLAAPAFAHGRRFKGVRTRGPVQRVVVHERSGGAAPVLAGLIGGFILGAAVTSNAQPVVVHERVVHRPVHVYRYYDPYEDVWFDSLDACEFGHHRHHPRIVYVIDVNSGRHVRSLRFTEGRWERFDDEWDDD